MDDAKRDRVWNDEYETWLKHFKKEYAEYDHHLKLCYEDRLELQKHVDAIVSLLKARKIWLGNSTRSADFIDIRLNEDDHTTLNEVVLSARSTCGHTLLLEKSPEEIEARAREMADFEVARLERIEREEEEEKAKEAKDKAEAEAYWKAHPEYGQHQNGLESHKKEVEEQHIGWMTKKEGVHAWTNGLIKKLDDESSCSEFDKCWNELTESMKETIIRWLASCVSFCESMNEGLSGFGLYAQNSDRTLKHRKMFEAFKLEGNDYADSITKQYDFACEYDFKTETYKPKDFDKACRKVAYALHEAKLAGEK